MSDENIGQIGLANKLIDFVVLPFSGPGRINDITLFRRAFQHSINLSQPAYVAGFIGQGGKDHVGKSDFDLLDRYARLREEFIRYYSYGAEISLIGGDIHGAANAIEDRGYLRLMQELALKSGFYWVALSDLYSEKGLTLPIKDVVRAKINDPQDVDFREWRYEVPPEVRAGLMRAARRHNDEGNSDFFDAFYYFVMRNQEHKIFIPDWQNYLFVINGSEDLARWTFPQSIPQMYWFSIREGGRKGRHMKQSPPWFQKD